MHAFLVKKYQVAFLLMQFLLCFHSAGHAINDKTVERMMHGYIFYPRNIFFPASVKKRPCICIWQKEFPSLKKICTKHTHAHTKKKVTTHTLLSTESLTRDWFFRTQ